MSDFSESVDQYDYYLKFLLLGESASGKTSIARRLMGRRFRPKHHQTLGVNIEHFLYKLEDNKKIMISLWDLDGQAIFRNARTMYFGNTSGVMLVLDTTKPLDMTTLGFYFEDIEAGMKEHEFSVALIGSKIDLQEEQVLPSMFIEGTGILLADQIKADEVKHFEISSKTGQGIKEMVDWLVKTSVARIEQKNVYLNKIFSPDNYQSILFQLTEIGPEVVIKDFDTFGKREQIDSDIYLMNLGVGISVAIAHGQHYSVGTFDLPAPDKENYRLFVYAFRLKDPLAKDKRLIDAFLQFCIFIPNELQEFFGDFKRIERRLYLFASKFETVQDLISIENLYLMKKEALNGFKETANLKELISPFD
jgi:small GTP-binding protein